jgi:hypothetical protein
MFTSTGRHLQPIGAAIHPSYQGRKILFAMLCFERALPHYGNAPSRAEERIERALVTFDIFREFGLPKCLVRLRHRGKPASSVPVPITPVHEDGCPMSGKHKVRTAGKFADVKAKSEALCMQMAAHQHLRSGVSPPVRCHHPGSDLG